MLVPITENDDDVSSQMKHLFLILKKNNNVKRKNFKRKNNKIFGL